MTYSEEFLVALGIAEKAHSGQKDKVGADYILHPKKVSEYCRNPQAKIAALLHDVIKDSDLMPDDLLGAGIDENIVTAVDCLTKRNGESLNDYYNR